MNRSTPPQTFQYVDPTLPRRLESWHSQHLGLEMSLAIYGDTGHPLILFPTAAADFLECERFFLIKAIEPQIMAGRVQVFSIDSINRVAWMDDTIPVAEQARRQALYMKYVEEELVPFIQGTSGDPVARPITAGASFGAFHAMNALCRRPDLFGGTIALSGFYDLDKSYLRGYRDDNAYYNNPAWYVRNLEGDYLRLLQTQARIVLATGQGQWEHPEYTTLFAHLLDWKNIPHLLDLWGFDVDHDWPWWREMLPYFIDRLNL